MCGKQTNLIFFDLLYKQKRYAELLEYFEDFKNRLAAKQQNIIRSIYVLVFATCYAQVNCIIKGRNKYFELEDKSRIEFIGFDFFWA